jgi:nitroreductase
VDVRDAVRTRHSIRSFSERAVERELLVRVLEDAAYAPSGGNLQPWQVVVVGGETLHRLNHRMQVRLCDPDAPEPTPDFPVYPQPLKSPYRERRYRCGEMLYAQLGIGRDDRAARLRQFDRNYRFFGAPVGLMIYVDREMHQPQWADLGIFLQTLMLLLTEQGIDTCPQAAWSVFADTVADVLHPPAELTLFCGLAIGYATDDPVNLLRTERAPLAEWCTFLD